jgi:hypothetical protein
MPEHHHDLWLVNGSPVFGTIPTGLIAAAPFEAPIYLFRGNPDWGWTHISQKHGRQRLFKYEGSVEELVWAKCSQHGDIHVVRDNPRKLTITITVAPTAFMALRYLPDFQCFSIVTMYSRRVPNPERVIGRYVGPQRLPGRPIFAWLPYRPRAITPEPASSARSRTSAGTCG